MTRIALDSNILVYFAGVSRHPDDEAKIVMIEKLIRQLKSLAELVAPSQALGELFVVLRKAGAASEDARSILLAFSDSFGLASSEKRTVVAAADLVVDHKFQFWDALIVNAAIEASCTLLLSEDMQHGFVTRGLTIVNPLHTTLHPKLAALLDSANP